ncbi:outer membrane protein [Reyranella sp.]|uniref:outer membrane protein n=1 Tax=Reyranella sp. TaxID=1929291 RepID=UPI003BAA70BC
MKKWTSFGLVIAATAMAATPLAAQQPSPAWNGFYAGLNAGGLFGSTSSTFATPFGPGGFSGSGAGFAGGAQGGYNYLFGPVLLGAEVDFQGSTYASQLGGGSGAGPLAATTYTPWFSTMRLRAGYTVGSVMPYVTGGAVWGQRTVSGGGAGMPAYSASNTYWTWTVGGGVEGMIADRWSMKLEYLYMGTPSTALPVAATVPVSESTSGNLIRLGVNYHF